MSIGYTWEKLSDAVLALACSDGILQHRLARAYRAMDILTPDDFPDDELREAYAKLVHAWRPGEPGDVEGTVAPARAALRPDQARAIAEKLLLLYTGWCTCSLRLIQQPAKPRKIPSSQPVGTGSV